MTSRRSVFTIFILFLSLFAFTDLFAQADSAKRIMASGFANTHAENLKNLNSPSDEASPFVSPDESTLYFSSYRGTGRSALYKSKRKSAIEWGDPELMMQFDGKQSISVLSIASDGHTAVVQCCNRPDALFASCDIYLGDLNNGNLQNLRPLGKGINSEWWEGQPSISSDGQLLFFSSDRKHGQGGRDIYMCTRNASGDWSEPVDLSFNTGSNEISPFIAADNQTLYFASDRSGGEGGFDIYVTYRKGDNEWTEPKNMGPAVNTRSNEMFFSIPPHEDAVYVTSDRPGGAGGMDLYRIVPNPVKARPKFIAFSGRVLDAETNQPVRTEPDVSITISATGDAMANVGTPRNFKAEIPIGKPVRVKAGADGYVSGSVEAQTPAEFDSAGFSQDVKLTPAAVKVSGHTTDLFTNAKITGAKVTLEEVDGDGKSLGTQVVTSDADGAFSFDAKLWSKYRLAASAEEYQGYYQPLEDIAPKREAVIRVSKEIRMTPADIKPITMNFDLDKSDLKPNQLPQLEDFIGKVKKNPYVKLELQGYTDERGSDEHNQALSERRANAVRAHLLSKGVPTDQIAITKGYGKSNPLDPSSSEEAWAKNRRVEIRIVGK